MSKGHAYINLATFVMVDTLDKPYCEWAAIEDNGFEAINTLFEIKQSSDACSEHVRSFTVLAIARKAGPPHEEHELNNAPLHIPNGAASLSETLRL